MDFHIDAKIVKEEVNNIFGRNGKNKFKTLLKNKNVYQHTDNLKEDIEILADKSAFDELLIKENEFFEKADFFNLEDLSGEIIATEFDVIYSKRNISTLKALNGVNEDVYQYEVQLESNGIMNIGWATQSCVFTDSMVVGETENSYSFDGYNLKKLNMSSDNTYGKKWRVGNIIGCIIDISNKTVEYFNNGQSLGKAFEEFNEDGLTYFPALSLSMEERVSVNFGKRPFKFPVFGAKPIQTKPVYLIQYFEQLNKSINYLIDNQMYLNTKKNMKENKKYSNKIIINNIIKEVLFNQYATLMKVPYIIDYCFRSFLNNLKKKNSKKLIVLLELMWDNIPESDMIFILGHLIFCMLCDFKCTWRSKFDTSHQVMVLKLLAEICKETKTRKKMLEYILFDKVKFAHFLHIIAPSDEMLGYMIPFVHWSIEDVKLSEDMETKLLVKNFPQNYKTHKLAYVNACKKIKRLINELEDLQLVFLKTLLNDNDQTDTTVSSRVLFSRRFQTFVQETMIFWKNDPTIKLPSPVLLSTFFRLSFLVRDLWNEELSEKRDAKILSDIFYMENYNYFGSERIGGAFIYLKSKYKEDVKLKLGPTYDYNSDDSNENTHAYESEEIIEIDPAVGLITILTRAISNAEDRSTSNNSVARTILNRLLAVDHLPTDKKHILSVLLNNIICLYHIVGHKQIIEYVSFKAVLMELTIEYAVKDYEIKTSNENKENLEQILKDLEKKIILTTRHVAWLMSLIFVDTKGEILSWIVMTVCNTLKYGSENEKELFRFVPEFYIDSLLGLTFVLYDYTSITQENKNFIFDKKWLATLIGEILLQNIGDNRIVSLKSKDIISQGIIMYLTHPKSLEILQGVPEKSRLDAMRSILRQTPWKILTKVNIILMLIWYGSGFGFRYTRPPHLENQRISYIQGAIEYIVFDNMGTERPPATVLQNDLRKVMADDKESAYTFIKNVLKHLDWAFSEFINLFQEIKYMNWDDNESTISLEKLIKLKMCGKFFILSVISLRVIEMVISFDRAIVTDQEGLLERLICQILVRVNLSITTFSQTVTSNLRFLEFVHEFTILAATSGVLLSILEGEFNEKLMNDDDDDEDNNRSKISNIPEITDVLISDPNFMLSTLDFIILREDENDTSFSLKSYERYFTEEELKKSVDMYQHLKWYTNRRKSMASSIAEDNLCVICYLNKNNVTLKPCKHQCCKTCMNHHILYSDVCFYCKRRIESVVDKNDSSVVIHNFGSNSSMDSTI